jgi:hypothetical protein
MATTPVGPRTSATTERAVAFVAAHKDEAERLGVALADHIGDPDAFAARASSSWPRSLVRSTAFAGR